jgi:hypothetical protein
VAGYHREFFLPAKRHSARSRGTIPCRWRRWSASGVCAAGCRSREPLDQNHQRRLAGTLLVARPAAVCGRPCDAHERGLRPPTPTTCSC